MKTEASLKQLKRGLNFRNLFIAITNSMNIAKSLRLPYLKMVSDILSSGWTKIKILAYTAFSFKLVNVATVHGDLETGVLPLAQVAGLVNDIPTVSDLIARIVGEAEVVCPTINVMMEG
jgi:hypothetical protein